MNAKNNFNQISARQGKFTLTTHWDILNSEDESKLRRIKNRIETNNLLPAMARAMSWTKYGFWHDAQRKAVIKIFVDETGYQVVEPVIGREYRKQYVRHKVRIALSNYR